MFGSNPFGQSSSSPFGAQPAFGQSTNASNPFASKPFGSTAPFGAQSGSSFFGSTTTGAFGGQSSSPMGSTSVFGAASSPAFGSSTPAFGASSTPAFGNSSSPFGSTSAFGQKPAAFGAFGSTSTQASPFGSSFQQSQPAFGSNVLGSSPFGSSQSAFGTTTAPGFGSSSTPAFGATSTPSFGSTTSSPFSGSAGAFGVSNSSVFGSVSPGFGASSPGFGAASAPAFGAASTPGFGTASTPAFGASSTPAFGASTTSAFGAPSTGIFGVQPGTPSFGAPGFGQPTFGTQRGGSRAAPYAPTTEVDTGTQAAGKLESISAMPIYKDKSHEELRWEDYQLNDKGGPAPANPSTGLSAFGSPSTSVFGQSPANPFSSSSSSNPFAQKTPSFSSPGFGTSVSPAFASLPAASLTTSNPFGSTATTSSLFNSSTPAFTSTSPSPFGSSSSSAFGQSNFFGSSLPQTSNTFGSGLSLSNSQSSPLFQSSMPSSAPTSTPFGQTMASFGQNPPAFGQINAFNTQSTGFGGNLFTSTQSSFSNSMPFGQSTASTSQFQTAAAPAPGGFGSFGQTPAVATSGFGGTSSMFGQSNFGQPSAIQNTVAVQSAPANPFGTLPTMPQMSIGRTNTSPSVQYGISSLPVLEKSVPARVSSYLTSRHLSQRRVRLPARKYHPNIDSPKVPFFSDGDETTSTPKADAFFVPRENPRALVIRPLEKLQLRINQDKTILSKSNGVSENGNTEEATSLPPMNKGPGTENKDVTNGSGIKEQSESAEQNQKANGTHENHPTGKGDSYVTLTSQRAAITFEHGADIETLMPKLRHSDYYTEPRIQELAAKERAEPGYCQHVRDFVVGRHGYGRIKFTGETDVRRLDLESLIQFNDREVIVYMDESKKPPVGQGLNKPAEVTLLNIKCFDKKTGQQCTEGPRIEKYKEMLKRKTEDQGAEFVSYDPVKGEWKFRVYHFSKYKL